MLNVRRAFSFARAAEGGYAIGMDQARYLGGSPERTDAPAKTGGALRYTDDRVRPGTLHAALLYSPYAHARIASVDLSRAEAAPGVRGAFAGDDWPDTLIGLYMGDKPPLARGTVRYYGDRKSVV